MNATAPVSTTASELDRLLERLKDGSRAFARLSLRDRIDLLEQMRRGYRDVAAESVEASCRAKGIPLDSPVAGEEWLGGPLVTLRILRLTGESLRDIQRSGSPHVERPWMQALPDGRLAMKVFPTNTLDSTLLAKNVGEVHFQPGVTPDNVREHMASFYRQPHGGRLCVVLGGGNVNAIPPTDCIYKMFVEGTVCVLKMNPVNAYLGPFLERAFRAAVEKGFFAVVYGGPDEGSHLIQHALVDEVHITGSDKTHDMLVWGPPGLDREARMAKNQPLLRKDISSELGNVTPVIVVPGPYSDDELAFQGQNIAGMVCNNASFNCNAAKLLVTPKGWGGRGQFVDRVVQGLARAETRKAYYPGAEERWKQFTEGRKGLRLVGSARPGELPYALIPDVDPSRTDDRVFSQEPWCAVLSETGLSTSNDAPGFLGDAVRFVNEKVWGTLCAILIVHPETMADPAGREAVESAIRGLRYGAVAVNTWPGAVFGLGVLPWGAHPTSTLSDIQSGRGWVHNTLMLESLEKAVLRAPVKAFPVTPWFPGHRGVHTLGRRLAEFEFDPSWLKVPGIAAAAMRA